jgi:mannosyltransferase
VIGALMLLALVIRARGIGTTNLWLDEANSWLLTTYSVHGMLANIRHSPSSPLYFLLLKLWTLACGDSTTALRAFSLTVSVLLLPLVYWIGRETVGRAAAIVAVALLATSPLQLYFAQEARVYMLATLLATLATAAYLEWRSDAVRRLSGAAGPTGPHRALVVYALAVVASLYTLPLVALLYAVLTLDAVLLIAARGPGVSSSTRRAAGGGWVIAQIAIAVACLPLLVGVDAGAAASSQAWRGPMGVAGATRDFLEFFIGSVHGLYFYPWDLYPAIVEKWGRPAVVRLVVVFPLLILAIVTAFAYPPRTRARGPVRVLYWALLVPLVSGAVVSIWHELSLTRYLLFVSPYLSLLLGAGVVRAPRWLGVPVFLAMLWASAYGLMQYPTILARDSDYRPTAALLIDSARAGEPVIVQPPEAGVQLAYYVRGTPISMWGMLAGAAPEDALRPSPGARTWVVLDYRSRWYSTPPESLAKIMPGRVVRDAAVGSGDRRVRVIVVRDANPSPQARGLSDTAATCCETRSPR